MPGQIPPQDAFPHVHEHYRWLAAAACSWDDWRSFTRRDLEQLDRLLPNVHVAIQASALVYARGLIEFYRPGKPVSDIRASDFGIDVSDEHAFEWLTSEVKPSIDQHLAHITEF